MGAHTNNANLKPLEAEAYLSPAARATGLRPVRERQVAVLLARGERHHAVGVGRRLERPEALHVGDVEHVQGVLEAHRHALAVQLDRQHGREEVHLADRVVLLGVPETQPTRAVLFWYGSIISCRRSTDHRPPTAVESSFVSVMERNGEHGVWKVRGGVVKSSGAACKTNPT